MRKIDIHLHLAEQELLVGENMISSAEDMLKHLDHLQIEKGILMSSGESDAGFGSNAVCRRICERYPSRYAWMCNLDEKEKDTIKNRLATYKEQGAVGVGEVMMNHRLDHPFLKALFKSAEELELPVLIHMSPEEGFQYGVVDEPRLPFLEEVLKDYPALKLIGHSQPFWHEISKDAGDEKESRYAWGQGRVIPNGRLVELFEKYPNLYGDLSANSGGCAMMRDEKFGLWFMERFKNQLMFGTDMVNVKMTFPLGTWMDRMWEEGKLSTETYENICFKNARKLFKI